MAFDGQQRDAAPYIYPNHAASGAPVDGIIISSALQVGYVAARSHSQLLVSQASAWNGQRPNTAQSFSTISLSRVRWFEGVAYIPKEATHLRAVLLFGARTVGDASMVLRLGAYTKADLAVAFDTGDVVYTVPGVDAPDIRTAVTAALDPMAVGQALANFDAAFETQLLLTLGVNTDYESPLYVEGYLGALGSYRPLITSIWWEIREGGA